ncbi:MAG: glycosyltransferase family 4 protein [Blautia sp.]|nr:glycosyltransferase family 4 protein [Blautia sp.]MCM1200923.1 glycosyltransferase family 4 protein [Bacteroides fragilis]
MIVPNAAVKGGIASVVNGYRGSVLEKKHTVRYVESYCDGSKLEKLFKALKGYFCFLKILSGFRPDIVHIHSSFGPSFYRKLPFIYLACLAHIPVVNHIHGSEIGRFYEDASETKKKLVRKVYGKCGRLIVLSEEWKEKISAIVPPERIDVLENYCILPKEPYDTGRNGNQILYLGKLEKDKGSYDMADILEKVRRDCPRARLVMAGDGRMEQVKEAFAKKGLLPYVKFTGWVRGGEKEKLLRESAVFLFPSYHEAMPVSVIEAMGYGMGIVASAVGGIPRLIQDKESGYLEAPGDSGKMAEDVISLLQKENLCRSFGRRARQAAGEKYSLEIHLRNLERIYRKTCGQECIYEKEEL